MMNGREKYTQIGFTALRDPATKEFLPSVPLFIRSEDGEKVGKESLVRDIGSLFAEKMRAYQEGCREAGITI